MSTPTWSKRASAICVAIVRCQIKVYSRSWSRSIEAATRWGVRITLVGRTASWASWALRLRVLYRRNSASVYRWPYSVFTSSAISRRAVSAMLTESVRM